MWKRELGASLRDRISRYAIIHPVAAQSLIANIPFLFREEVTMITVKDLLKKRGSSSSVRVSPTDTVYRALQLMAENNVGAVMICENDYILGIFTERDYCRKIILMGRSSVNTPIQDIMTKNMVTVQLDQTLEECIELMAQHHIRHLPVQEDDRLVGIVSMRDVMETLIAFKQDRIDRLENYILGTDYGH
jgi:CBS domain-containing protein